MFIGLFQLIAVAWIYGIDLFKNNFQFHTKYYFNQFLKGSKRFIKDVESMIGPRPKWFRYLIIAFWNIICPIGVLVIKSIYFYVYFKLIYIF